MVRSPHILAGAGIFRPMEDTTNISIRQIHPHVKRQPSQPTRTRGNPLAAAACRASAPSAALEGREGSALSRASAISSAASSLGHRHAWIRAWVPQGGVTLGLAARGSLAPANTMGPRRVPGRPSRSLTQSDLPL